MNQVYTRYIPGIYFEVYVGIYQVYTRYIPGLEITRYIPGIVQSAFGTGTIVQLVTSNLLSVQVQIVQSAFGTGTIVQLVTCECVAIELLAEIKYIRFIVDVE